MALGPKINPEKETHQTTKSGAGREIDFELTDPKYNLSDIIVNQNTLQEIKSVISLKRDFHKVFNVMGFSQTHKYSKKFIVNFYGPPGTGKTITAHAIAREFNKKILIVDYSQIESKYVGDTPKNLKKVFEYAKSQDCIIFFDEADAILSRRVTNMQSATDTSVNQTRSVLLNILNDFDGDLIFATNFISNYDPAFMRRISKHVLFELPDQEAIMHLFKKYTPNDIWKNINFDSIVKESIGLSAADIEKSLLMGAFHAVGNGRESLSEDDILKQIRLILNSKKDNEQENRIETRIVSEDYVKTQIERTK